MNCRILEDKTFEVPAVAGLLSDNFIEARLHTDGPETAARAAARELQARYASSIANPWLVVVDPKTGEKIAERGYPEADELVEFLTSVL